MISLQSSGDAPDPPQSVAPGAHTVLVFHDVVPETRITPEIVPPAAHHAEAIIRAARAWDRAGPLLVHCALGVSRSPAAALIALAALRPDRSWDDALRDLRARAPSITPNARLIALGDAALGLGGALVHAVAAIGRGRTAMGGEPFALEVEAPSAEPGRTEAPRRTEASRPGACA